MAGRLWQRIGAHWQNRRRLGPWQRAVRIVETLPPEGLRGLRGQARQVQRLAEQVLARIAPRLPDRPAALPLLPGSEGAWRPLPWDRALTPAALAGDLNRQGPGGGLTVFHDAASAALILRQGRNRGTTDLARHGITLESFHFDGSFLSLVLDLPAEALAGLGRRHILRVDLEAATERPGGLFARLNLRHGPNTEQVVRDLPLDGPVAVAEFDLGYTGLGGRAVEAAWLDLILHDPVMNRLEIRDLVVSRRLRADF